jgi:hypothetical protein
MIDYDDWRRGYAKQALADLRAREALLDRPELPDCQQLHFLQMACEKLCKAYLCGLGVDPQSLQTSHAYITAQLPAIARQQFVPGWVTQAIRVLARKIELLAPAVSDAGRQPANCEYPWVGPDGSVRVPCEHNFGLNLLYDKVGRHLLKVIYTAVADLTG